MSKKKKSRGHPWRDNIEAVTVSIVIIVLFKYFVLEAYKIPTGSMQPTLMGWQDPNGGGIFDRVLVDKLSYHYRDPQRFEVVVFRYPLDRSKNFIKRIVGMPGEILEVRNGDLFHGSPDEPLRVLRRPKPIQRTQLKLLDSDGEWKVADGWTTGKREIRATGPGRASFPRTSTAVRDHYTDGYPGKMAERVHAAGKGSGDNVVADLRLQCRVEPDPDCEAVAIELREGTRTYLLVVPGPAAPDDARPEIQVTDARGELDPLAAKLAQAAEPLRLAAGRSTRIAGQNLDDLLELEVDGETVVELEIPAVPDARESGVTLVTEGAGARMSAVRVYRDIYYTRARQKHHRFQIPEGSYVMLGDNTQDSSDGRDWSLRRYGLTGEDGEERVVRGNERNGENPRIAYGPGGKATVFFHDELGERWVFPQDEARNLGPEQSSFVPRELIRGRAVLVVWPIVPRLDVYRIQWVR